MKEKLVYSWENFDNDVKIIKLQLLANNWIPDYIVGVKRGGLIPAIKLSHTLNKPMIMMSCQLRDSADKEVRLYEVEEIPKDKNILIVDDICDSGITMSKIIIQFLSNFFPPNNVKTCSLFYNISQNFYVDYYARSINRLVEDRWISFPWESTQ
jgi:hypoxanthine phosphoribosyltransferase